MKQARQPESQGQAASPRPELPPHVWEHIMLALDSWQDVWSVSGTCRNTLAARQTPAFIAEWLVLWRKADPLVVDRVFTAFRRPPYMKVILPIVLQRLVLEGAQYRTQSGLTPLGFAAHAGLTEAAQALLNANVDANEPADSHQQRALHLTQTYPIAQALITSGADVQLQDICGRLPLHAACRRGATDIVQALLAAGADPNAKDAQKATPLCYAVDSLALAPSTRHVCTPSAGLVIPSYLAGLVEALVVAGAGIDAYSGSGSTALHKAASAGHEGLVQALLQRGADPGLKDFMRRTAAERARQHGHEKIALFIEKTLQTERV